MKNLNKFLVVCLVLATTISFAQETKYGIRAGVGIPNLKSADDNIYSKDYESVLGFDGSIFGDFGISKTFSIKAELGFLRKGGERNGMQPIPSALIGELAAITQGAPVYAEFDNKAVFSYIEIPVLAKFEWDLGSKDIWGIYVNAGPYIDFMLSPKQKTESNGAVPLYWDEYKTARVQVPANPQDPPQDWILVDLPPQDLTATTDIQKDLATVDFGVMYGFGITVALDDNNEFLFDVRGSNGLIPIQKDRDTYGTVHMGNLAFAVGYAYTIPSKKSE